ncbi:MAG TPA: thioesterase family protein [Verrucomicrobiae bacterium]|jgi:acyl-CoA thioester hydrolase/thioesterase-3|nr:thioesterase family protein [Verrucomicrobiae bacterium]
MSNPGKTRFTSELHVRPDDIDMNQHVHASRYFDYVLAARYDQMARCYQMSMEEFLKLGLGWFVRTFQIEYKRPLSLGDWFIVATWVDEISGDSVKVGFQITRKSTNKLVSDGFGTYTLVNLETGRAEAIPDWIVAKYSI